MLINTAGRRTTTAQEGPTSETRPEKIQAHSGSRIQLNFVSGLFAGAAISSLVPWSAFGHVTPSVRLGMLALLCAGFVSFRLLTANRTVKKIIALVFVSAGGFLISTGPHFAAKLQSAVILAGAVLFLCGIILLLRQRSVPSELSKQTIERLMEKPDAPEPIKSEVSRREAIARLELPVSPSDVVVTSSPDRLQDEIRETGQIHCLAHAIGIKTRFHPPSGSDDVVRTEVGSIHQRRESSDSLCR